VWDAPEPTKLPDPSAQTHRRVPVRQLLQALREHARKPALARRARSILHVDKGNEAKDLP
jgi:hypothetical protein